MTQSFIEKITCMSPQLIVTDLELSIAFYTQVLGFSLNFRHEDFYAGIDCHGHSIHVKHGLVSKEERQRKRENEDVDIVFGVKDINAVFAEISQKDIEMVQPLREMPYGKEFYIADPDGYLIAFFRSG